MPETITPLQFWLGVLTILLPQLVQLYNRWQEGRENKPVREAEADEKLFQSWERLAGEYVRQIENLRRLETEVAELRPLTLKIALQEQEMKLCREDKEDWKSYANRLATQLEQSNLIPLPFRRTPQDGDTGERMKTVSRKVQAVKIKTDNDHPTATNNPQVGE